MMPSMNVSFKIPGFGAFADAHNTEKLSEADRLERGDDPEVASEAAGLSDAEIFENMTAHQPGVNECGNPGWGGPDSEEAPQESL